MMSSNRTWTVKSPTMRVERNRTLSLDGQTVGTKKFDFSTMGGKVNLANYGLTFARAGAATFIRSNGLVGYVASGDPRFTYELIGSTYVSKGVLIEAAVTNRLTHSETFSTVGGDFQWTDVNITRATGQVSPDGTTNAVRFTASAANATITHGLATAKPNTQRVWSAWIRRVSGTGAFQVSTTITSPTWTTVTITSEWVRYQGLTAASQQQLAFQIVDSGNSVEIWGAQLENGTVASSYVPVTFTPDTRGDDQLTMSGTNFTSWFTQPGTFVVKYFRGAVGAGDRSVLAFDIAANKHLHLKHANGSATSSLLWTLGSITATSLTSALNATAFTISGSSNAAVRMCTNGGTVTSGTSDVSPSTIGWMNIGTDSITGIGDFEGHLNNGVHSVVFYPRLLSDIELQTYTGS
jgi:hypothetical protein